MKETKKQIKAQMQNKFAKKEKQIREMYHERLQGLVKACEEAEAKKNEYYQRAIDAEEKVRQYEEWIERMQDFCNMSEEDRALAIENYKNEKQAFAVLDNIEQYVNAFNTLFHV